MSRTSSCYRDHKQPSRSRGFWEIRLRIGESLGRSLVYEFYNNVFDVFLQKHLRLLSECARTFGAVLELAELDLSIFKDAITTISFAPPLQQLIPEAVAYLLDMTSVQQREMEGFGRWYHDMHELAVFGTEDEPIIIAE